jgi:ABC-type lipoprotein export system ATPase subunit
VTPAVETRDAYRIYESAAGGAVAIQGLSLVIDPGEIVVVLGPSGSGKTTLLRVLAGFERLSAGSARVLGVEISRLDTVKAAAFRARHLGLLDQHYARSLSPDLTCLQSVALQLQLLGAPGHSASATALEALERVGLADRARSRPALLSGGEQQRVAVCAAIAHKPELLLADEPAGELDEDNAARIYAMIAEFVRERGCTALIVSHDTAAAAVADRLVHVRDGRVVEEGRPGEARSLVVSHGWVRIPEPALRAAGHPGRLAVAQDAGRIVLEQTAQPTPEQAEPVVDAAAEPGAPSLVCSLDRVVKRYAGSSDGRAALDELTWRFCSSTFTAVVGRSGSGKTTLLHLMAGLERPTGGTVTLLGQELTTMERSQLAATRRDSVALVTQEPGLVPYLSALENVRLALALRGHDDGTGPLAEEALVEVGLEHRLTLEASKLSAGERQRVAIARALAARARLLLVDEPTARLDEENALAVARLLARAAHQHGIAVVCATHDPVLIEAADEIVPLAQKEPRQEPSRAGVRQA